MARRKEWSLWMWPKEFWNRLTASTVTRNLVGSLNFRSICDGRVNLSSVPLSSTHLLAFQYSYSLLKKKKITALTIEKTYFFNMYNSKTFRENIDEFFNVL